MKIEEMEVPQQIDVRIRFEQDLEYCNSILENDPDNYAMLFQKGEALYELGRYGEAIASFDNALKIDPEDMESLNMRAMSLHALKRYEEEIETLEKALKVDPECVAFHITKAQAFICLEQPQNAVQCFDDALQIGGFPFHTLYAKGCLLQELGRHEEAVIAFNRAINSLSKAMRDLTTEEALAREKKEISLRAIEASE